jgi:hypothetical protein
MSIRKRSATIARPENNSAPRRRLRIHVAASCVSIAMVLAVLTGCAEGASQDAERGKLRDAQRTSVVRDMQATHSARVLEPGTPPPATEMP